MGGDKHVAYSKFAAGLRLGEIKRITGGGGMRRSRAAVGGGAAVVVVVLASVSARLVTLSVR